MLTHFHTLCSCCSDRDTLLHTVFMSFCYSWGEVPRLFQLELPIHRHTFTHCVHLFCCSWGEVSRLFQLELPVHRHPFTHCVHLFCCSWDEMSRLFQLELPMPRHTFTHCVHLFCCSWSEMSRLFQLEPLLQGEGGRAFRECCSGCGVREDIHMLFEER